MAQTYTLLVAYFDSDNQARVQVEADSFEEACERATTLVNDGDVSASPRSWDPQNSFVYGVVEGDGDPWAGDGNVPIKFAQPADQAAVAQAELAKLTAAMRAVIGAFDAGGPDGLAKAVEAARELVAPPVQAATTRDTAAEIYEATARAFEWEHGGDHDGIWWHAAEFGSWKEAVSWGTTYETAKEVCEFEALDLRVGQYFDGRDTCRRLTSALGAPIDALTPQQVDAVWRLLPSLQEGFDFENAFIAMREGQVGFFFKEEFSESLTSEQVEPFLNVVADQKARGAAVWLTTGEHTYGSLEAWAFIPEDQVKPGQLRELVMALEDLASPPAPPVGAAPAM